ncbi:hypothetical protein ARMSODRAFT_890425, partial [Armillaria solidipes]
MSSTEDEFKLWKALNPDLPYLHISMNEDMKRAFIKGYRKDAQFKTPYQEDQEASEAEDSRSLGKRFLKDEKGLLYFMNTDHQPRLCVPKTLQQDILTEAHKSPLESAH